MLDDIAVTTAPTQPVVITLPALTPGVAVTGHGQPASGSLVLNPDQTFTYTPAAGFLGADEFTYSLRLADNDTAEGRVLITVARPNQAPIAASDGITTGAGAPVLIPVLANDNDPDGDPLRIVALAMPAHGTVSIEPDQRLRYVPQTGFAGSDSFSYTVSDGMGGTASAAVDVAVERLDGAPVAAPDTLTVLAGGTATVAVLANDNDPDGDRLILSGVGLPRNGTLRVNADQTITYGPHAGFVGADEFTYQVSDGRGGVASARVAVEVRRPNQAPLAVGDEAATPMDTAVTVNLLGNDSDPDGDPVTLVALGLPQQGTVAVNPDRTVVYTPKTGYIGPDEFTYTVSDGWGGTASARVALTVGTIPDNPLYPNGYAFRRLIAIPARLIEGEHEGFPVWLRFSGGWLRPLAAGGNLVNGTFLDVRFELPNGTKLPHEVEVYETSGVLAAWVRLPRLSADEDVQLHLYYGKPGLTSEESSRAAVWADYLAVWHLPAAEDRGPANRALTKLGSVNDHADGLAGSVALGGAGVLERADAAAWLGGLGALTVQLRARASDLGHTRGVLNAGAFGNDTDSGLTLRYAGAGGALYAKLKTSAGDATLTTAGALQSTSWQSLALAWAAGDARLGLYVDGAPAQAAQAGEIGTGGGITTAIAGALVVGAGSRDGAAGGWQGRIDEVRVRAQKLAPGWLAAEHANQSTPDAFYGVGAEDSPDDRTLSPVAVPIRTRTLVNSWVDIDVLANAVLAPGGAAELISVAQPAHGIASIIAGQIRYTPTIGFIGSDSFTYTLGAGAKRTTSRITVSVEQLNVGLPVPRRAVPVSSGAQLSQALANAQAGDHIILANGTYNGNFTASRAGSAAEPVVIRAATPLGAKVKGSVKLTAANVWIWGLNLEATSVELAADRTRMSRCRQTDTTGIALLVSKGRNVEIDRNELAGMRERGISLKADPANPTQLQDAHIHHNYLHDFVGREGENVHEGLQLGQTKTHTDVPLKALVEHNLFENVSIDSECISIKSSDNIVRFNTLLNCRSHITNRHGERNELVANWIENSNGIRLQDRGGRVIGNRLINCSNGLQPMAGNVTPASWPASGTHPAAEAWVLAGNNANKTVIGYAFDGGFNVPARNIRLEAHTGPVTLATHNGTVQQPTTSIPIPTARRLTRAEVGPEAA